MGFVCVKETDDPTLYVRQHVPELCVVPEVVSSIQCERKVLDSGLIDVGVQTK
jgi:hypothetical protein